MSALGHKRTFGAIAIYVRYWGLSGHPAAAAVPPTSHTTETRAKALRNRVAALVAQDRIFEPTGFAAGRRFSIG
jgi:hypothetical protein